MELTRTQRNFVVLSHEKYQDPPCPKTRLIQESSAIGDYDDSLDKPGSSFLWVGQDHHLNREQVQNLIEHMQRWLHTGRLFMAGTHVE